MQAQFQSTLAMWPWWELLRQQLSEQGFREKLESYRQSNEERIAVTTEQTQTTAVPAQRNVLLKNSVT